MGFSRGGLLTLMVGIERRDLKSLLILAPAPGRGRFAETVLRVASLNSPVLLLVEAGDRSWILEDFEMLERHCHTKGAQTYRRPLRIPCQSVTLVIKRDWAAVYGLLKTNTKQETVEIATGWPQEGLDLSSTLPFLRFPWATNFTK